MITTDAAGNVTSLNEVAERLTGWTTPEVAGKPVDEIVHIVNAQTREKAVNPMTRAMEEGVIVGLANDTVLIARDGTEYQIADSCAPVKDPNGNVVGAVLVFRDVTKRKRAEEALRESEALLARSQEMAHIGSWTQDLTTDRLTWSDETYRIFGCEPQTFAVTREAFLGLVHPEDRTAVDDAYTGSVREGRGGHEIEHRILRRDTGEVRYVHEKCSHERDATGAIIRSIGTVQDLTDRKRAEEAEQRANRLESLGLLAGGIAHDFNNVLTGVVGNLSLLSRMVEAGSEVQEVVGEAQAAASRARGLTGQLLTFARGGAPERKATRIEELVRATVHLSLRGSNVKAEYRIAEGLPAVDIDAGQIGQVVQNVVLNADQAMPGGGVMRISAERVAEGGSPELPAGEYVKVTVEDGGTGIPKGELDRVFDPFYTTKETGHGLGLSICHSIMKRHGGQIAIHSEEGRGTRVALYLPVSGEDVAGREGEEEGVASVEGRVLVMDDEESVHRVVGRFLRMLGMETVHVREGGEAVGAYRQALEGGRPFDVVVVDLTVPGGMGGQEALRQLQEVDPRVRVVVASGYSNDPVLADPAAHGFVAGIGKPINMDELARVMSDAVRR